MKWKIGTIASHSALTILSGAQSEGFETVLFTPPNRRKFYESFGVANQIIEIDKMASFFSKVDNSTILIPHGSFISYLDIEDILETNIPIFGNRELLKWESDRKLKEKMMMVADLKIPQIYNKLDNINFPVIVKYDGAAGGKGYFIATSKQGLKNKPVFSKSSFIQQYIIGTKVYCTFFNSIIHNRLEIFGTDIRYESDVDAQFHLGFDPSFQVVGNIPMVLRESILNEYYDMGQRFQEAVKTLISKPMSGPFCLETIIDRNLDVFVFEFSGRIVAGTNIFVPTSPYSQILFKENMSMGKRIARELAEAIELELLENVCL